MGNQHEGPKTTRLFSSIEHIRLIEKDGYKLKIFPIIFSDVNRDKRGIGPATIEDFIPELSDKTLKKVGDSWYASDDELTTTLPEEVSNPEYYIEGASSLVAVNTYERNANATASCLNS